MVQIYERRPSALTEFVNEAGAYAKEQNEFSRNQKRSQQAFNKARQIANQPDVSPSDLYFALTEAATQAGTPDAGRQIAAAFPLLLQANERQQFGKTPQPGQQTIPGQSDAPQGQSQATGGSNVGTYSKQPSVQETKIVLPIELPPPSLTPFGQELEGVDLGLGPIPKTYSEDQYRQVANQYNSRGLDPKPAIDQMRLEDEVSRSRLQDMIGGAKTLSDISSLRRQHQEAFRGVLREQLPNLNESDFAIAERISQNPELRNIKNDKVRAEQVRKDFNLYEAARSNFQKNSVRRDYDTGEYERQKNNLGNYAKTLVKYGQRDKGEEILANNGWGPVEISEILNPLPKEVVSGLRSLPKAPDPQKMITVTGDNPKFAEQAQRALVNREKVVDKYKNYIEKNFKTGSYDPENIIKPGTSLLQLRDLAMQNDLTFQEYENIINDLIQTGKIQLDSYQNQELPLLSEHPIKSFSIGEILWRLNPFYNPRK